VQAVVASYNQVIEAGIVGRREETLVGPARLLLNSARVSIDAKLPPCIRGVSRASRYPSLTNTPDTLLHWANQFIAATIRIHAPLTATVRHVDSVAKADPTSAATIRRTAAWSVILIGRLRSRRIDPVWRAPNVSI